MSMILVEIEAELARDDLKPPFRLVEEVEIGEWCPYCSPPVVAMEDRDGVAFTIERTDALYLMGEIPHVCRQNG